MSYQDRDSVGEDYEIGKSLDETENKQLELYLDGNLKANEKDIAMQALENSDKLLTIDKTDQELSQEDKNIVPVTNNTAKELDGQEGEGEEKFTKMTWVDIFFFKSRNANSMRCIALYNYNGEVINYRASLQQKKASEYVFTLKDLFYSRRHRSEFIKYNYATADDLNNWFKKKDFSLQGGLLPPGTVLRESIRDIIADEFQMRIQHPSLGRLMGIHDYLGVNNLALNVFILFIAFSDKIATLSMYTPTGVEPSYFYKPDSQDMRDVLSTFNRHKENILTTFFDLLVTKGREKNSNVLSTIAELKDIFAADQGSLTEASICQNFLEAYANIYQNEVQTILTQDPNNGFFQHYVVKFTLLTTTMVTLQKECAERRGSCMPIRRGPAVPQKQKRAAITQDNITQKAIAKKQQQEEIEKQELLKKEQKQKQVLEDNKRRDARAIARAHKKQEAKTQQTEDGDNWGPNRKTLSQLVASEKRRFDPTMGGSTKIVLYLVKIEKIRELNKKLRKNKTKNKTKIEKNNKLIDELKVKIKKQKEKEKLKKQKEKKLEKEKLKKQKEKEKLKKQKEKEKLKKQKEKEKKKEKSKKKQKK